MAHRPSRRLLVRTIAVIVFVALGALTALALGASPRDAVRVSVDADGGHGNTPIGAVSAVTASGRQFVVWEQTGNTRQDSQVWSRIVDGNGAPVGEPFNLGSGYHPAVAVRGRREEFLVAWTRLFYNPDTRGPGARLIARRFDANGEPRGDEFLIAEGAENPVLAYGGRRREFMIVWEGYYTNPELHGARFPADSSSTPASFPIGEGAISDLAYDSRTGRYLLGLAMGADPFVRILPADPSNPLGRVRRVTRSTGSYGYVRLAYNRHEREYLALSRGLRRIDRQGRPYGKEVQVKRGGISAVATHPDGHYLLLLNHTDCEECTQFSVYCRRVSPELKLRHRPCLVSSYAYGTAAFGQDLVWSRSQERMRAVWSECRGYGRKGESAIPECDIWTRGL